MISSISMSFTKMPLLIVLLVTLNKELHLDWCFQQALLSVHWILVQFSLQSYIQRVSSGWDPESLAQFLVFDLLSFLKYWPKVSFCLMFILFLLTGRLVILSVSGCQGFCCCCCCSFFIYIVLSSVEHLLDYSQAPLKPAFPFSLADQFFFK